MQLKNWHSKWKIKLIESMNKDWRDLYSEIANPLDKIYL
jgi:predicted GIY-YIG superfamily endonuclease